MAAVSILSYFFGLCVLQSLLPFASGDASLEGVSLIQRAARAKRGPAAVPVPAPGPLPVSSMELAADANLADMTSCKNMAGGIQLEACSADVNPVGVTEGLLDAATESFNGLGAEELGALDEDILSHVEGVSLIQEKATMHRVSTKPSEPVAWEPVDEDMDIMAMIDDEEGLSMVQTKVAAIHHAPKDQGTLTKRRSDELAGLGFDNEAAQTSNPYEEAEPAPSGVQEGFSLLQVTAQYKYKQPAEPLP